MTRAALCLVALALGMLTAASARAQSAEEWFGRGRELLHGDRPEAACAAFARSQELRPTAAALLNLGLCHRQSGRLATALDYFRRAEAASADAGDEERRAGAALEAGEMVARVGTLEVQAAAPVPGDLVITIDGTPLPRASWPAGPMDAGDYRLEARTKRGVFFTSHVIVTDGAPTVLRVPAPPPQPPPAGTGTSKPLAPVPAPSSPRKVPVASYVAGGVGLAAIGIGLGFGVSAWTKYTAAETECPTHQCASDHASQLYDAASADAKVANVAVAIGVVSLATGVVLYFTHGSHEERRVAFRVVQQGAGAAVAGEF